jgi:hypothetical protein
MKIVQVLAEVLKNNFEKNSVLRNKTFLAPIKLKIINYKRNEIDGNEMKETVKLHNISNPSIDITGCFIIQ